MEETIRVNMLGEFTVTYHGEPVNLPYSMSNKSIQLLLILWCNVDHGVPRKQLIDMLYGNEDVSDAASSFRVTVFRLRKMLAASVLPQFEYIINEKRIYCWDAGKITVETDACMFERKAEEALKTKGKARIERLVEACRLYRGEFLRDLLGEEWVELERGHYQHLYETCLTEACDFLMENRAFETSLELSHAAAAIYPYEEWFLMEIDSLIGLKRFQEAMEVYEKASTLLFDKMGVMPSEEMVSRFREMSSHIQLFLGGGFLDIQKKLAEKDYQKGAYYCSYPSFIDSYRLISRMADRSGQSTFLMFCTLTGSDRLPIADSEKLNSLSEKLRETIEKSLRRGDLFTRYGRDQFLILLPGARQESCTVIEERIEKRFKAEPNTRGIHIEFLVSSAIRPDDGDEMYGMGGPRWK